MVVFHSLKHTATAVGIAMLVDEAASSTGILKHALAVVAVVQQLGLNGTHAGIFFKVLV